MASDECKGKSSWPELVGKKGEDAVAVIEEENPHVNAETMLEGSMVTADVLCTRVRVWVNTSGIVYRCSDHRLRTFMHIEGLNFARLETKINMLMGPDDGVI